MQKRLEAQNSKNHYTAKLADEDSKVKAVEEVAKGLQEEFEVNCFNIAILQHADSVGSHGRPKPRSIVNASRILAKRMRSSAI